MILITGATGFIGKNLVKKLKELHYGFCCLIRNKKQKDFFRDVNYVVTSLEDYEKLSRDLSKIKFSEVIHLASSIDSNKREAENDYKCALNLIKLCKERNASKIVFSSSYLADPAYESYYGSSKRKSEEAIKKSGVNYTILRMSQVYGQNGKHLSKIISLAKKSNVIPVVDKRLKMQPLFVDDAVSAIIKSLKTGKKLIIDVAGDDFISMESFADAAAKALDKKIRKIEIPVFALHLMAPFGMLKKEQISNIKKFRRIDNSRAKNELKMKFTRLEEGIRKSL